jgi:hypothetical protein
MKDLIIIAAFLMMLFFATILGEDIYQWSLK